MRWSRVAWVAAALVWVSACEGGGDEGQRGRDTSDASTGELPDVTLEPGDGQDLDREAAPGDGVGPFEVIADVSSEVSPDACARTCAGRQCGDDGCGGSCGACSEGLACSDEGHCVASCAADCLGRQCGDDGCGGSCGTCDADEICSALGHCVAAPTCAEVTKIGCCDGDALWACDTGVVVPTLCPADAGCGWLDADGAYGCGGGGVAGPHGAFPLDCPWVCRPLCVGQECGDDGCGGSCGECPAGTACDFAGACCAPSCVTADGAPRACGPDGCGGSCGDCALGEHCAADGQCANPCELACVGRDCGDDGCGGSCGQCADGQVCTDAGACVEHCTPACGGKSCGGDGCGGSCGTCAPGLYCQPDGTCDDTCAPQCGAKECGDDGCGGSCGACEGDLLCTVGGSCGSACTQCSYGPGCLAFDFEAGNLLGWSTVAEPLVLTAMGATPAPQGTHMLDLDTAGESGANDAATIQTCVPSGAFTLHFLWRLYSEEFVEFCGSNFDDYFRVTVAHANGHAIVFERTIDDLCAKSTCPQTCGAYEVPLVKSDVGFDQGDAWVTPWQAANVPLDGVLPGAGGVVSITFEAGDVGDSIYDTHILVDEIALRAGCEAACEAAGGGTRQCGSDGCGGQCGACSPGHPCAADGLCGACQPQCAGKACGPDGCGGTCGTCAAGSFCQGGACVACQPQCTGANGQALTCGADGCGGTCGTCSAGQACQSGACVNVPAGLGSPCTLPADCPDGMYCLAAGLGLPPAGETSCTVACEFTGPGAASGCPEGWTCFPNLMGNPVAYCVASPAP